MRPIRQYLVCSQVDYTKFVKRIHTIGDIPEFSSPYLVSLGLGNTQVTPILPANICNYTSLRFLDLTNLVLCYPACIAKPMFRTNATAAGTYPVRCPDENDEAICNLLETSNVGYSVQEGRTYSSMTIQSMHPFLPVTSYVLETNEIMIDKAISYVVSVDPWTTFVNHTSANEFTLQFCLDLNCQVMIPWWSDHLVFTIDSSLFYYHLVNADDFAFEASSWGFSFTVVASFPYTGWNCSDVSTFSLRSPSNSSWYAHDLCSQSYVWTGVTCEHGDVTALDLKSFSINGTIPDSFRLLTSLESLDLSFNSFQGSLPLYSELSNLENLVLRQNKFAGTIPDDIDQKLAKVQVFDVSSNLLRGTIPSSITLLTNLQSLILSYNSFSGQLSDELCQFAVNNGVEVVAINSGVDCYQTCWIGVSLLIKGNLQVCSPTALPTASPSLDTGNSLEVSTSLFIKATVSSTLAFLLILGILLFLYCTRWSTSAKQRHLKQEALRGLPVHRLLLSHARDAELLASIREYSDLLHYEDFDGNNCFHLAYIHGCSDAVMTEIMMYFLPKGSVSVNFHAFAWTTIVQHDKYASVVATLLERHSDRAQELATAVDENGRTAINISSEACRVVIKESLYFMKTYELHNRIHQSTTSVIYRASNERTDNDDIRQVAIKFMTDRIQYSREVQLRVDKNFRHEYVIDVLEHFDGEKNYHFMREVSRRNLKEYQYCIVMPLAEKDLESMLSNDHIAGISWPRIKLLSIELTLAIDHLHSKGVVHCDLKPKNVISIGNSVKLIDLDCSTVFGSSFDGSKYSSGFLAPECFVDDGSYRVLSSSEGACLPCHPSRDMWALGQLLFKLFTGAALFNLDVQDNLDDEDLRELFHFSDEFKAKKLNKIKDKEARNLVSQLLVKNPANRPGTSQVLAHPFLSGKAVPRMVGQPAELDVFLSYRVKTDLEFTEKLYNRLTSEGLKVWWDKKCLEPGIPWHQGFCHGLINCRVFVPILTRGGINNPTDPRCNLASLEPCSACDSVLVEHTLALEFRTRGLIDRIFPLMVGDALDGDLFGNYFDDGCHPIVSRVEVASVMKEIEKHLELVCLGSSLVDDLTVKGVLDAIMRNQGKLVEGSLSASFNDIVRDIKIMCTNT